MRWDSVEQAHHGLDDGAELITFLRSCAQELADLVRGEDSALSLLFPHGDIGTAEAAYKDNIISRYVNQAVTAVTAGTCRPAHGNSACARSRCWRRRDDR